MTEDSPQMGGTAGAHHAPPSMETDAPSEPGVPHDAAEIVPAGQQAVLDALNAAEPFDYPTANKMAERAANSYCDVGNAFRLVQQFGEDLLYVPAQGWYHWDGVRWSLDGDELAAQRKAHGVHIGIFQEYSWLKEQGPRDDEEHKDFEKRVGRANAWALQSGMSSRVEGMSKQARPYLEISHEDLDADPRRITVANKTLTLGSDACVEVHEIRRTDLITRSANVAYDPNAECPTFRAFLEGILPDKDVRTFLQRFIGYCATGLTREQCLLLLYGTGANGKSTLVEVLQWVLGDYAMPLPFAALLRDDRKQGSAPSPELARLPGARLVVSSEADAGAAFSESLLKGLTGGA